MTESYQTLYLILSRPGFSIAVSPVGRNRLAHDRLRSMRRRTPGNLKNPSPTPFIYIENREMASPRGLEPLFPA